MTRKLEEIVEDVMSGVEPDGEELFYAVAALNTLLCLSIEEVAFLVENSSPSLFPLLDSQSGRMRSAGGSRPADWLRSRNADPKDPEYQEWRQETLAAKRRRLH